MQIVKNPFVFIGMIALTAALILSCVSEYTKDRVKINKELDKKKNILLARYFVEAKDPKNSIVSKLSEPEELIKIYESEIEELLFLESNGTPVTESFDFSKLVWKENKKDGSMYYFFKGSSDDIKYLPLFKVKGEGGGFIVPISGKGLWSTIKGFIYIVPENEAQYTVKGISFYEHGETPGLGGEIDVYDIKARYIDKKIDLNNARIPKMLKTPASEEEDEGYQYELDYISGATITSDGLNQFIGSHILDRYKIILLGVNK